MQYFTKRVLELMESKVFYGRNNIVVGHHCKKDNPHLYHQSIRISEKANGAMYIECGGDRNPFMMNVNSKTEIAEAIDLFANQKDEEYRFLFLKEAERLAELYDENSKLNQRKRKLQEVVKLLDNLEGIL